VSPDEQARVVAAGVVDLRCLLLEAFMRLPAIDPTAATADALPYLGARLNASYEVLDEASKLAADLGLMSVHGCGRARVRG
jgi:hypothetical protein